MASASSNIKLLEDGEIHDDDVTVAQDFGEYFSNMINELHIPEWLGIDKQTSNTESDPILNAISMYHYHPSILKIKQFVGEDSQFSFSHVSEQKIREEISRLVDSKASPMSCIPPHIIKEHCDIFAKKIHIDFNASITNDIFSDNLKHAYVSQIFKTGDSLDKSNYRPISILPPISKIFERLYCNQIEQYIEPYLSTYQCGFRKNFSAQNCILLLIEKWKKCLDKKGACGVLLTDLSKAFDCLRHDLLIAKLNAYGFDYASLKLIHSYLSNRFQRVRINSRYSTWFEILFGVPQGSIFGPLVFNIDMADLFLFSIESIISNYADDNNPFLCAKDDTTVIEKLTSDAQILLDWFITNGFKANPDKFHLLASTFDAEAFIQIDQYKIHKSQCEKLLGIKIDHKLSFEEHVTTLCTKASQKLHALSRVSFFMSQSQRRLLMKAFINSHFGYCPLVWMFHSRKMKN